MAGFISSGSRGDFPSDRTLGLGVKARSWDITTRNGHGPPRERRKNWNHSSCHQRWHTHRVQNCVLTLTGFVITSANFRVIRYTTDQEQT